MRLICLSQREDSRARLPKRETENMLLEFQNVGISEQVNPKLDRSTIENMRRSRKLC